MAETSIGWTTSGTGDGSASGYTMAQFTEWQRMLLAGLTGTDLSGVAPDYLNKLAVTGAATPVAINTGGAVVYGFPYFNSASVNVTIPTPGASTRVDVIVLRASWAAQTVRITRVAGTEGAGVPSITQTAGTTWDMALANVSITTGGTITLTDRREWLTTIGDLMVTTAKIALLAVDTAQIAASAVTSAKIGTGVLRVMYIPLIIESSHSPGGIAIPSSSYFALPPRTELTAANFPSNSTVKLHVLVGGGTAVLKSVELYNATTSTSLTNSLANSATSTDPQLMKSSDFRADLTSGANQYQVRGKIASGTLTIYNAYLFVEW